MTRVVQFLNRDAQIEVPAGLDGWQVRWNNKLGEHFFHDPRSGARRAVREEVQRAQRQRLERELVDIPAPPEPAEAPPRLSVMIPPSPVSTVAPLAFVRGKSNALAPPPPRAAIKQHHRQLGDRARRALSGADAEVFDHNPHIRQAFAAGGFRRSAAPLSWADRCILETSGRTPYARRADQLKTVESWPRRSSLLMVIEFLTRHSRSAANVLFAGSAPVRAAAPWSLAARVCIALTLHRPLM